MIGERARGALAAVLAIIAVAIAVRWFAGRWEAAFADGRAIEIAWGWVLLGCALLALHAASSVLLWRRLVTVTEMAFPLGDAIDTFAPTLLARYIPGKVWANGFRILLSKRVGVPIGTTSGVMVWEVLLLLFTAGLFGLIGTLGAPVSTAPRLALVLLGTTTGAWILLAFLARTTRGAAMLARVGGTAPVRSIAPVAHGAMIAVAGWCLYGAAHLAFARAVAPVTLGDWALVSGAVALAWAGGFIAFIMPVGLGVRDGIQVALLSPLLGAAPALLLVAVSRVGQLATDGVLTAAWALTRLPVARPRAR